MRRKNDSYKNQSRSSHYLPQLMISPLAEMSNEFELFPQVVLNVSFLAEAQAGL